MLGLAAPLGVTVGLGAAELVEQVHRRLGAWPARLAVGAVALGFAAVALGSWQAYSAVPVSARWWSYQFPLVDLANAGNRPNSAVIVDQFQMMDVWFLDYAQSPTIVHPETESRIHRHSAGSWPRLAGSGRRGCETAAQAAKPAAWDLSGNPSVWVLTP